MWHNLFEAAYYGRLKASVCVCNLVKRLHENFPRLVINVNALFCADKSWNIWDSALCAYLWQTIKWSPEGNICSKLEKMSDELNFYLQPGELRTSIKRYVITFCGQMKLLSTNEQEKVAVNQNLGKRVYLVSICVMSPSGDVKVMDRRPGWVSSLSDFTIACHAWRGRSIKSPPPPPAPPEPSLPGKHRFTL